MFSKALVNDDRMIILMPKFVYLSYPASVSFTYWTTHPKPTPDIVIPNAPIYQNVKFL